MHSVHLTQIGVSVKRTAIADQAWHMIPSSNANIAGAAQSVRLLRLLKLNQRYYFYALTGSEVGGRMGGGRGRWVGGRGSREFPSI